MAVFTRTWNTSYESQPADTENVSLGALRIRNFKVDVQERMVIDHEWKNTTHDGKHKKISLRPQSGAPAREAGDGVLYMDNSSPTKLIYIDDAGDSFDIGFPAGTKMLFYQSAAPAGWAIDATLHDKLVRVVDGTTLTGGSARGDASWGASAPVTVDNHTLTVAQIPAHTHSYTRVGPTGGTQHDFGGGFVDTSQNTGSTGGGDPHNHNVSTVAAWRPPVYDFIVCTKS